jgi:hypothetical protein
MASLTEFVAAVVVHSSSAAFSHFGVVLEVAEPRPALPAVDKPTVSRSPREDPAKAVACPEAQTKPRPLRA